MTDIKPFAIPIATLELGWVSKPGVESAGFAPRSGRNARQELACTRYILRLLSLAVLPLVLACCSASEPPPVFDMDKFQQTFSSPKQAMDTLIAANRKDDKDALLKIFGPQASELLNSGDPVADKESRKRFVAAYDAGHRLESNGSNEEIMVVGREEWPAPIPIVKRDGRWYFDTEVGEQEIINRRIGHNELSVIKTCKAYVQAQKEFAAGHPLGKGHFEYAQKIFSTPGKHDGLYWPVKSGEKESPLGPLIAEAQEEGYLSTPHRHQPYHGYYYKILRQQGPHAKGGTKPYIVKGHMTGGFALLAFPAKYGDSGIMTFIVNQNGVVYQQDLGDNTPEAVKNITEFDPDGDWKRL